MSPKVTDEFFDYSNSPYYVLDSWLSEEAYFTTAYFVDTAIICNGGRYTVFQISHALLHRPTLGTMRALTIWPI